MKQVSANVPAALVIAFAVAVLSGSSPADAAQIKVGAVCKAAGSSCRTITSASGPIPLIAGITFNAPTAGTALVSFHGTMQCLNAAPENDGFHGVVDFTTQILANGVAAPDYQAPGGQRISMRIPPVGGSTYSLPVNLASSLVVPLTAGAHPFVFKMVRNRMDEATQCIVFNGNLTVVFVP